MPGMLPSKVVHDGEIVRGAPAATDGYFRFTYVDKDGGEWVRLLPRASRFFRQLSSLEMLARTLR